MHWPFKTAGSKSQSKSGSRELSDVRAAVSVFRTFDPEVRPATGVYVLVLCLPVYLYLHLHVSCTLTCTLIGLHWACTNT